MATTSTTLVGVFDDLNTARTVREELASAGFSAEITSADATAHDAARGGAGLTGEFHRTVSPGGGITGFFRSLFGTDEPEDELGNYTEVLQRGGVAVTTNVDDDRLDRAIEIMNRHNPVDIDQRVKQFKAQATDRPTTRHDLSSTPRATGDNVIPVVQEQLQVGKRQVRRGGVRIISRVTERPVEERVNLREENVHVDRRAVNRPAKPGEIISGQSVIELTETVEEPVVSKQARVVEEVVVGKETTQRTETIRDTVRRTDVDVQQLDRTPDVDYHTDFRRHYDTNYASAGSWADFEPAYRYGTTLHSNSSYAGRKWEDIESLARTDYLRNNPNSKWDNVKGAVRYGWERMTGQRPADTSTSHSTTANYTTNDYTTDFRKHFDSEYGNRGESWVSYEPAYTYGYQAGSKYSGRDWDEVESQLKTDYLRNNPNSKWDNIKGAVRYGWERMTGQRPASDEDSTLDSDFRRHFTSNYEGRGYDWSTYEPAYRYGSVLGNSTEYRDRGWDELESRIKTDYLRNNPNSKWDNVKGAVRFGWEKVTGKR